MIPVSTLVHTFSLESFIFAYQPQNQLVVHSVDVMIVRSLLRARIHTFKKNCWNQRMFARNILKRLEPLMPIEKRWIYKPGQNEFTAHTAFEPRHLNLLR